MGLGLQSHSKKKTEERGLDLAMHELVVKSVIHCTIDPPNRTVKINSN